MFLKQLKHISRIFFQVFFGCFIGNFFNFSGTQVLKVSLTGICYGKVDYEKLGLL